MRIDLLMGGSPCQGFSKTISNNIDFDHPKSKLFFEFVGAKNELNPKYFLLENVPMKKWAEDIITEYMGVKPIRINSNLFSAQDRERLYWTNIPFETCITDKNLVLKDILIPAEEVADKYWYREPITFHGYDKKVCATVHVNGHDILKRVYNPEYKCGTLTAYCGGNQQKKVYQNGNTRKLLPIEYERLQTLPDGYTDNLSDSRRYNTIGNGWTVDVIAHILRGIPEPHLNRVVSLFDGISCGQVALERAEKKYDQYFASEINEYAIDVTMKNYPDTIQLGDVESIKWENWL